ncbi:oligosaccharide flippase family protein [Pseudoduganella aquatica]|uniref:oligosaccharide flippase family protein n=1 Tax=Pseudoduganella aquatica TaxID=2660641 RepID=UPI001E5B4062|nr:oligosaccharide flippase family protein [Pseudoduganella aquatica]
MTDAAHSQAAVAAAAPGPLPLRRSLALSFVEKYALLLLALAGSMVLGRLLTPAETGVYSVAAVLAGLAQVLRDFGVGQYLVQEKDLTPAKLRAALCVSVGSAWTLGLLVLLAAPPLAAFYQAQQLRPVLQLLALNFLMVPFTSLTVSMLRRQMRFASILLVNAAAACVQLACSVWLAWRGWGSLSLACGAAAGSAAALLASVALRPAGLPWLPHWRGAGTVLRYGGYAAGGGLIDQAGVAAPDLIVGKLIGVAGAGIYGKAQSVINLFNQAITSAVSPVAFSLYAAQARAGQDARAAYLKTISCMTALAWPFFAGLGLMAQPVVRLLYGDQWDATVPLIQVISLGAALYSMFSMARYLFLAGGHVREQARLDAMSVAVRIAAVLLAAPFGLDYVAWGLLAGALGRSWFTWRCLARLSGLALGPQCAAVARSAVLAGLSSLAPLAARMTLPSGPFQLLAAGAGGLLLWVAGVLWLEHELAAELRRMQGLLAGHRWRFWKVN